MFREKITEHGERVKTLLKDFPHIATIEASTKTSLIEPFLQCLGYDTSHPQQVSLEVLTELGGRIDYLLTGRANAKIAVEAKKAGTTLSVKETNQLRSYFTFSESVAGVLTNGVDVWLFTDLSKDNVMDAEPYLMVDTRTVTESGLRHLETLTRNRVSKSAIHKLAQEEQRRKLVRGVVTKELNTPSQDFLRLIGKKAGIKPLTKATLESLQPLVAEALSLSTAPPLPQNPVIVGPHPPAKPSSPSPILTAGQKAAETLKKFQGATLFGDSLPVTNYTQLLVEVAKELLKRHPDRFKELVQEAPFFKPGRKWQWVSRDEEDIFPDNPRRKVGDFFFDVVLSAKNKEKRARLLLERLGHKPEEDLQIHLAD